MSDRVVRALSRIRQGKTEYRTDISLAQAKHLVSKLASEISNPPTVSARRPLDEALFLFATAGGAGTAPASTSESFPPDANLQDIAAFLNHLAGSLGEVIDGSAEPAPLEFALAQFDALAEATLNSATERSNPKESTQLWAMI